MVGEEINVEDNAILMYSIYNITRDMWLGQRWINSKYEFLPEDECMYLGKFYFYSDDKLFYEQLSNILEYVYYSHSDRIECITLDDDSYPDFSNTLKVDNSYLKNSLLNLHSVRRI